MVAARLLGVATGTVQLSHGWITSTATDRSLRIGEVAAEIYRNPHGEAMEGVEPTLESTRSYKMPGVEHQFDRTGRYNQYPTWSFGAVAVVVEVDPVTGTVQVLEAALAHDCGIVVNPVLANAQLHGAVMQGIGSSLYEEIAYDEQGRPSAVSLREYTIPSTREWVPLKIGHRSTPSPLTHRGMKGVGESGISAPAPAIAAAIEDALSAVGIDVVMTTTPCTPARIWRTIAAATAEGANK